MSDLRLPSTQLPATQNSGNLAPSGPPAAVRNAQAAFFRAALDQANAAPPRPVQAIAAGVEPQPTEPRIGRPGSLLDIRV
jgi:hypothetical protein